MKSPPAIPHRSWRAITLAVIALQCLFTTTGCKSSSSQQSPDIAAISNAKTLPSVKAIADDISTNVGRVMNVVEGDPKRVVIVFEETHVSPAGQIATAVMLNRLYERYGLRHIGLEGALASNGDLGGHWFPSPPLKAGQYIRAREDVIVQLLEKGEISNAEMMALIYADVTVTGIEKAEEYNVEIPKRAEGTAILCLYKLAASSMKSDNIRHFNTLVQQKKEMEAIEYAISLNEFTKDAYHRLTDNKNPGTVEEQVNLIEQIETKAADANVALTQQEKDNLSAIKRFFQTASERSKTMVSNTAEIVNKFPVAPVAMITGAAHSEGILQRWKEAGVSFAVIRANSLVQGRNNGDLTTEAYERKMIVRSVDPSGALGALLDGRKKPPPVIGELWLQSEAQVNYLTTTIARATAQGKRPPFHDTLKDVLPQLTHVTLDPKTIQMIGNDVVFKVSALNKNSRPMQIWIRARTDRIAAMQIGKKLEQRLLEGLTQVSNEPPPSPTKPEPLSTKPIARRVSSDTIAKFARSETAIKNTTLGRITFHPGWYAPAGIREADHFQTVTGAGHDPVHVRPSAQFLTGCIIQMNALHT